MRKWVPVTGRRSHGHPLVDFPNDGLERVEVRSLHGFLWPTLLDHIGQFLTASLRVIPIQVKCWSEVGPLAIFDLSINICRIEKSYVCEMRCQPHAKQSSWLTSFKMVNCTWNCRNKCVGTLGGEGHVLHPEGAVAMYNLLANDSKAVDVPLHSALWWRIVHS